MKGLLFKYSYLMVNKLRKVRGFIKIFDLKLRGVDVNFSSQIRPSAVFEPSGGSISIGPNTFIDNGVILRPLGGSIEIGSDCSVNAYSVLYGSGGLRIGSGVRIAAHAAIFASNHVFSDPDKWIKDQGLSLKGIIIEDDVWIGAGARILDGVVIGKGTVVGAGAVVTRSTECYSVVAGIPAKKISSRIQHNHIPVNSGPEQ
jgi:acetyltransferase-like isoleucine patch superfamily enzyme